jgi:hypothetical protein
MSDCPQCNELSADLKVAMDLAEAMSKRNARLVEAVKVLKDYVDLPASDYCSREMNEAWEVFKALEAEAN